MLNKKNFVFLGVLSLMLVFFCGSQTVYAQNKGTETVQACFDRVSKEYVNCIAPASGIEVSSAQADACRVTYENAQIKCSESQGSYSPGNIGGLINPLSGKTVPGVISYVIRAILGVVGSISLILFIYAGVQWMTARGNPEQVKSATKTMMWTVLGLVMIFGSYLILNFVFKALGVNSTT